MTITGQEAEETLHKYKKKAEQRTKQQSGTRKIIAKDEVLKTGEAAEWIRCRYLEEIRYARLQSVLKDKRGKVRQSFQHKLDFLAALDDSNRSKPRGERASSQ